MADGRRVLAISLEAAEATVVRRMIARGELPALARLAEGSAWLRVAPERYVGSVPLWPSFTGGVPPEQHGRLYGPWLWDPNQMRIAAQVPEPLRPPWSRTESVGLFDVPGTPESAQPREGFAIRGWGSHNPMELEFSAWPPDAAAELGERHPFECDREINYKTGDRARELRALSSDALRGLRMRGNAAVRLLHRYEPEVAIVNFPELHRGGHWLWHTLEPDDALYASLPGDVRDVPVTLGELYREADRQVAAIVDAAGTDTEVVVFALNGMEAADGIVDMLGPLLIETGFARIAPVRVGSLPRRALATVKAHTPARLKQAYYAALPRELTLRVSEFLPDYDWARTRAFAMPSEQHGWIRVNLAGREAQGIVPESEFDATCDELESMLRALVSPHGEPLVKDVVRTTADDLLPDIAVHWARAAFAARPKIVPWLVGQHTTEGFCLAPPRLAGTRETVLPEELQELVLGCSRAPVS